jgi:hypothetical protein
MNLAAEKPKKEFAPKHIEVSFISIGAGIDKLSKDSLIDEIHAFELKNNIKLDYSERKWGREGEVSFCFDLSKLNEELCVSWHDYLQHLKSKSDKIRMDYLQTCK